MAMRKFPCFDLEGGKYTYASAPENNTFAPSQRRFDVIEARLPGPVIAQVRLVLLTLRLGA
jgi:hypothetical protein